MLILNVDEINPQLKSNRKRKSHDDNCDIDEDPNSDFDVEDERK